MGLHLFPSPVAGVGQRDREPERGYVILGGGDSSPSVDQAVLDREQAIPERRSASQGLKLKSIRNRIYILVSAN